MLFNFALSLDNTSRLNHFYSCREVMTRDFKRIFPTKQSRLFNTSNQLDLEIRIPIVAVTSDGYINKIKLQRNKSKVIDFVEEFKWDKNLITDVRKTSSNIHVTFSGMVNRLPNRYYFSGLIYYIYLILKDYHEENLELNDILLNTDTCDSWRCLGQISMFYYKNYFLNNSTKYANFDLPRHTNGPIMLLINLLKLDGGNRKKKFLEFLNTIDKSKCPEVETISSYYDLPLSLVLQYIKD
jgi:hypothetical protein